MNPQMIRYFVVQTASSMVRTPLVQLIAISTITVSLTVLCSLMTLTRNLDDAMTRWNRGLGVIAFLKANADDSEVLQLAEEVRSWAEVGSVTVHDRDAAMGDIQAMFNGREALNNDIDRHILPISIEVALEMNSGPNKSVALWQHD